MRTATDIQKFLSAACTNHGFCIGAHAEQGIIDDPGRSAADLVVKLMIAEGLDPEFHPDHRRNLIALANHFGIS